jgi:hypothetical protein
MGILRGAFEKVKEKLCRSGRMSKEDIIKLAKIEPETLA